MTRFLPYRLKMGLCTLVLCVATVIAKAQISASFTVSATSGCGSTVIEIDDQSSGSPEKWVWNFGNGVTKNEIRSKSYKFTYLPGTYTITLQVWKGDVFDVKSEQITIYSEPEVDFELTSFSGCVNSDAVFTDKSHSDFDIVGYEWHFGDAGVSKLANPVHSYLTEGDYSVSLSVVDANGCSAEKVKNGYVHVTDEMNFSISSPVTKLCSAPLTAEFSSTCDDDDVVEYLWEFGDGAVSSEKSPNHTYSQDGMYSVSLTATANSGCPTKKSFENFIQVNAHTAQINISDTICYGEIASMSATASIPIVSCDWNFGDGEILTDEEVSVTHIYKKSGNVPIQLTMYGENGCSRTTTKTIYVRPIPDMNFTADNRHSCDDGTEMHVTFTAPEAVSYMWDFGDGTTSFDESPTHTYTEGGLYDVTLKLVDSHGCSGQNTIEQFITKTNPVADFTMSDKYASPHFCVNADITITDISTSLVNITNTEWEYLYDRSAETSNTTSVIQYNKGGEYPIKITVTDEFGCVGTKTNVLKIGDVSNIVAKIMSPSEFQFCPNVEVVFKAQPSPDVTEWKWVFSKKNSTIRIDTTVTTTDITIIFPESGSYSVLYVPYNYYCPSTKFGSKAVTVKPPTANFTYSPTAICSFPSTMTFDPALSEGAESFEWNFGDGTRLKVEPNGIEGHWKVTDLSTSTVIEADAETNIVTHEYTTPDTYSVTLTTYNGTCEDAITIPLNTSGITIAMEQNVTEICQGESVQFTDASLLESGAGTVASRTWTFNDGTEAEMVDTDVITHTFENAGTYNVELKIVSSTGCEKSEVISNVVRVYSNPTIQSFSADKTTGCADLSVQFSATAQAEGSLKIDKYIWSYDDGRVDTTKANESPAHTYKKGSYSPSLEVVDKLGCSSKSEPIAITATFPTADFSIPEAICYYDELQAENQSDGEGLNYVWTWGDGNQSTTASHKYSVNEASEFTVKLTATDKNNCVDNIKKTIVLRYPQADFVAVDNKTMFDCPPAKVIFKNHSIAEHATYLWNFGENSSTLQSIPDSALWQYQNVGSYDVTLIAKDNIGCSDTISRTQYITVNGPVGHFNVEPDNGCTYTTISMQAVDTKDVMRYSWVFGDGQFQNTTTNNVDYVYDEGNVYTPSLTIIDANGCEIPMVGNSVTIYGVTPDFKGDTLLCDEEILHLTDVSVANPKPIDSWTWTIKNKNYTEYVNTQNISQTVQHGTYDIILQTEVDACVYSVTKQNFVQIQAKPTVSIISDDDDMEICDLTSLNLSANILSGDDGNGPFPAQGTWSGNGVVADTEDVKSATYTANGFDDNTITYNFVSTYGCQMESPESIQITVHGIPETLNNISKEYCLGDESASYDLRNLLAHITGKLTWYDSENNSLPTAPTPSTAAAGTQIYYVTQTANDCESDKATATVTVFALPNPEITASNDSVCQGTEIALGLQNDYVSQVWSCAPNNYLTATDEKNPKLMANAEANTYVIGVKVTDEHGCENSEESQKSLTILEIPSIQFDMDKNAVEIFEDISFINRIDTTAYDKPITWSWTIGEQYSGTDYSFPYVFAEDGTYDITLTGYIYEACKDSLTKSLLVLPTVRIPNVFTPNGDGINDIFFDGMPETELIIINRWGQELYKGLGGWDGTYNGKEMSAGTYFYMITLPNGKTFNGPLMLIRN